MVSKALNIGLRSWQLLCSVVTMALIGNMIHTAIKGNSSMVNYDMFTATFGLLSLLYLLPTTIIDSFSVGIVNVALDVLNVIFWFCAAVATAAYLGVHSCSNESYTTTNHITNSSPNTAHRCREAQAATAFFWFGFAAWAASALISVLANKGAGANLRGIRRGPAMSQV